MSNTFHPGDRVTISPDAGFGPSVDLSAVYVIRTVPRGANGVNYTADPEQGGRGVRAPGYAFVAFDGTPPAKHAPIASVPSIEAGNIVTVKHPKIAAGQLYVVLGPARKAGGTKIVKLGGDGGRYWPSMPTRLLTVIDPSTIRVEA
jgi:hypothetical protein